MKRENGSALVQVLIMSVILIILATGVMKTMFASHVLVMRVKKSNEDRDWAERCYAMKSVEWQGVPCAGGSNQCSFTSISGPNVDIACTGNTVKFSVNWP